jgi:hypothetical protein
MRYRITYKGINGKWDEEIAIFQDQKHMLRYTNNLRKKGYSNIITQEYYDDWF